MTIVWIALIVLSVWLLSHALHTGTNRGVAINSPRDSSLDSAKDILDRRFAAGELDEETY